MSKSISALEAASEKTSAAQILIVESDKGQAELLAKYNRVASGKLMDKQKASDHYEEGQSLSKFKNELDEKAAETKQAAEKIHAKLKEIERAKREQEKLLRNTPPHLKEATKKIHAQLEAIEKARGEQEELLRNTARGIHYFRCTEEEKLDAARASKVWKNIESASRRSAPAPPARRSTGFENDHAAFTLPGKSLTQVDSMEKWLESTDRWPRNRSESMETVSRRLEALTGEDSCSFSTKKSKVVRKHSGAAVAIAAAH
jgi:tetratricopeptide (TPR) repeat protein